MGKATRNTQAKRKIIDIKPETFQRLSIMAASRRTNLKKFIENSLDELAEANDNATIFKYLSHDGHDGSQMVGEERINTDS